MIEYIIPLAALFVLKKVFFILAGAWLISLINPKACKLVQII